MISKNQKNNVQNNSQLPTVAAIVITVVLAVICFILNFSSLATVGDASLPRDIRYISGDSIDALDVSTEDMTKADGFSGIQATGKYLRISALIPASSDAMQLITDTEYGQLRISVGGEELCDNINSTGVFGKERRVIYNIGPSEENRELSVIVKNSFATDIDIRLTAPGTAIVGIGDIAAFFIWPTLVLIMLLSLIIWRGKHAEKIIDTYLSPALLCVGTSCLIYAGYLGAAQTWFSKFGVLFIQLGGVLIAGKCLKKVRAPENVRNGILGMGIIVSAVIVSISNISFMLIAIYAAGILHLVYLGFIIYFWKISSTPYYRMQNDMIELILFFLLYLSGWLFFFKIPIPYMLLQLIYPAALGLSRILDLKLTAEEEANFAPMHRQYNNAMLERFKPDNMGRFEDLLNIFLSTDSFAQHSADVAAYTYEICRKCDMGEEQADLVARAGFLHDIGKLMVPKSITLKNGNLMPEEYEQMKQHTAFGFQLFSNSDDELFKIAAIIARQHHERYDGGGYLGMKGDDINMYAAIVSIADVFNAVTTEREYKKSWSFDDGVRYIAEHSGTLFAPQYVDAFMAAKNEIEHIYNETRNI